VLRRAQARSERRRPLVGWPADRLGAVGQAEDPGALTRKARRGAPAAPAPCPVATPIWVGSRGSAPSMTGALRPGRPRDATSPRARTAKLARRPSRSFEASSKTKV